VESNFYADVILHMPYHIPTFICWSSVLKHYQCVMDGETVMAPIAKSHSGTAECNNNNNNICWLKNADIQVKKALYDTNQKANTSV